MDGKDAACHVAYAEGDHEVHDAIHAAVEADDGDEEVRLKVETCLDGEEAVVDAHDAL
jgi:hypothetical protein